MSATDRFIKRAFDLVLSALGLLLVWPVIAACWLAAAIETRSNGFFVHERIGRNGRRIKVIKIRTMHPSRVTGSPLAVRNSGAITRSGAFFRKYKLDELPQLANVLTGRMSFVGPRPDVPGYADRLDGADRVVLMLRPGITGPASIKYRDEERLLESVADPAHYNDMVIWPDKVRINREYFHHYSFRNDLRYLYLTLVRPRC